jgi:ABC-2 type transport system ATP-binding protein
MPVPAVTLEAERLGRRYGSRAALADVSLVAYEGEVLGLLGPNGAGKTTAIRVLTTVLAPSSGRFAVAGVPSSRPRDIRRRVGALPESAGYPARRTAAEYLRFHARLYGLPRVAAARVADTLLAEVGLADRAGSAVGTYSRGMRQRLGIARALLNDPAVVFLDEPTLGLDPAGHRQVLGLLRGIAERRRATVVLSTHTLADVEEVCSRVVILDRGRVAAAGAVDDIAGSVSAVRGARVTVAAGRLAAAREVLGRVAGLRVEDAADPPGTLLVSTVDGEPDRALRALVEAGVPVLGYEVRRARLDDAFLAVTRSAR